MFFMLSYGFRVTSACASDALYYYCYYYYYYYYYGYGFWPRKHVRHSVAFYCSRVCQAYCCPRHAHGSRNLLVGSHTSVELLTSNSHFLPSLHTCSMCSIARHRILPTPEPLGRNARQLQLLDSRILLHRGRARLASLRETPREYLPVGNALRRLVGR